MTDKNPIPAECIIECIENAINALEDAFNLLDKLFPREQIMEDNYYSPNIIKQSTFEV